MTSSALARSVLLAVTLALAAGRAAAADIFSPGELSRAHQSLEGVSSCTKCHEAGQQLAPARCLECHTELKARVEKGQGFHGRIPAAERTCQTCHHEHLGRDNALVDWGSGGQKGFDHGRTGFALKGKHRTADCATCHDPRRVGDPLVKAALEKQPGRKTFLGQPQACAACHFDEHRGQLGSAGAECARCHTEDAWKPARGFDHARSAYPLTGRHARVDCVKCHKPLDGEAVGVPATVTPPKNAASFLKLKGLAFQSCADCHFDEHRGQFGAGGDCARCHTDDAWKPARRFDHAHSAFPLTGKHARVDCVRCHKPQDEQAVRVPATVTPPKNAASFLKLRGLAFQSCADCHKDPHQDRFGQTCQGCHNTEDWKRVTTAGGEQRGFHERTRFPLTGGHAQVACVACHGPFPGEPAKFRGLPFERCLDCHFDAHVGQIAGLVPAKVAAGAKTCDRCHTVDSYQPARYEVEDHDQTGFKLEGAHRAVSCARCHPKDPQLASRLPATVRIALELRNRPARVSLARFDLPRPQDCRSCHQDPHGGQFAQRVDKDGCTACHQVTSFREVKFDHTRDSTFALTGKHAQVACGSCHQPDAAGVVRYRPLVATCSTCHADPHAGQFAPGGLASDCARCHDAGAWNQLKFTHQPPFTSFLLTGKHRALDCAKCHPVVQVAGTPVRRYRPLPTKCQGCHDDFHKGAFQGFVP